MIYARIILMALIVLSLIYYGMIVGQLFGKWKITRRKLTLGRLCIPFYYWIVSQNSNKPTK